MRSIGKIKLLQFFEERKVKRRYYFNPTFRSVDLALKRAYLFSNPYTISRKFLEKKGEKELHVYGETFLTSLEKIAERSGLSSHDHLIDLGCGRGRGALFLAAHFGMRVVGIDWVPTFIDKAQKVAEKSGLDRIDFRCMEMQDCDLSQATVIYLCGTCLEEKLIEQLIDKMRSLKVGAKVISVSYPLEASHLALVDTFEVPFLWGNAEVFIHHRV